MTAQAGRVGHIGGHRSAGRLAGGWACRGGLGRRTDAGRGCSAGCAKRSEISPLRREPDQPGQDRQRSADQPQPAGTRVASPRLGGSRAIRHGPCGRTRGGRPDGRRGLRARLCTRGGTSFLLLGHDDNRKPELPGQARLSDALVALFWHASRLAPIGRGVRQWLIRRNCPLGQAIQPS